MNFAKRATIQQQAWLWVTALLAIAIDQVTKWRVEATMAVGDFFYPLPALSDMLRLIHVVNTGAAWGTLEGFGWLFAAIAILVSLYLLYMNTQIQGNYYLFRIILGCIGGGALGNAIDRFRLGHVTDFIDVNFRPLVAGSFLDRPFLDLAIFNWADVFIIGGVLVLGVLMWTDFLPEELVEEAEPVQPTIKPIVPFSRPTSLAGYDPVIPPPRLDATHRQSWRQARTAVWGILLIVVSLGIWLVSWGISARSARRKQARRSSN